MPKMICTRAFKYGTRAIQPDEEFDVEDEHARVLEAGGKARRVNHTGQGYMTRQMLAEGGQLRAPQFATDREKRRRERNTKQ